MRMILNNLTSKTYDVVALGELLIDFTQNGVSLQGNPVFEANPGGAPCNVLAMLTKLGKRCAFIGKVGADAFGEQLKSAIEECKIDATGLLFDSSVPTTLAFVHTLPGGDRDFSFYRNPGADMELSIDDIKSEAVTNLIQSTRIFHFGTLSMTHEKCREATKYAVSLAKQSGALLSFDPNLRPPLWESMELAREQVLYGLSQCDILKISDNEIEWLVGEDSYEQGVAWIHAHYPNIRLILVSLGKDGSLGYLFSGDTIYAFAPAILRPDTIETTGAGDTFCGCVLNYCLNHDLSNDVNHDLIRGLLSLTSENLREMLAFANQAASIITTRKGALRVMPTIEEIEEAMGK